MDKKERGRQAEDLACEYLVKSGFKIIEKNCVLCCGEIDIIAKKKWWFFDKAIHFIEVKSLSVPSTIFFPEDKFNFQKKQKYRKLIEIWYNKNKYPLDYPCQIDLITVSPDPKDCQKTEIRYFENVLDEKG